MRIGFEQTVLELDAAGSARAARGLRAALADRVELVELAHLPSAGGRVVRGLDRELRWFPFALGRRARRLGVDVLHCPVALGPVRPPGPPLVVTVNDVLAVDHPEWYTRANAWQQKLVLPRLLAAADAVVVPSAYTRDRVLARFAPRRIEVIPYGVDAAFEPSAARDESGAAPESAPDEVLAAGFPSPYVLTLATTQPRKGLDAALDAVARLRAEGLPHRLVVVGARGWRDEAVLARLRAGGAVLAGRLDDAELVVALRGADALLFPSREEGFGFPPLEAMACGTPVVALRSASVPEVCGDAAELAPPGVPDALAAALRRVLTDPAQAAALRARGLARAAEFTWARCAERHVALYADIIGARSGVIGPRG